MPLVRPGAPACPRRATPFRLSSSRRRPPRRPGNTSASARRAFGWRISPAACCCLKSSASTARSAIGRRPLFNTLFNRIEKGKLKGQVKMLALAAGGNVNEIKYLYEQVQYSFPVVPDPRFDVHKLLGEPRTPFTLLVDPNGKVLHTHMGIVEDLDAFLKLINELVR
ncbi:MAG: hypothetical protein MZV70_56015 [Desulfobacterales bacterium]|nr:hypothetical protein [Desulfobacterales bacterium]